MILSEDSMLFLWKTAAELISMVANFNWFFPTPPQDVLDVVMTSRAVRHCWRCRSSGTCGASTVNTAAISWHRSTWESECWWWCAQRIWSCLFIPVLCPHCRLLSAGVSWTRHVHVHHTAIDLDCGWLPLECYFSKGIVGKSLYMYHLMAGVSSTVWGNYTLATPLLQLLSPLLHLGILCNSKS